MTTSWFGGNLLLCFEILADGCVAVGLGQCRRGALQQIRHRLEPGLLAKVPRHLPPPLLRRPVQGVEPVVVPNYRVGPLLEQPFHCVKRTYCGSDVKRGSAALITLIHALRLRNSEGDFVLVSAADKLMQNRLIVPVCSCG